ncbi:CatB-related O-acetyltransferase [Sphingobacterium siyangense]|uniref:CatB-related O-acetyltransferase n=1 Tax=Sphingobacterium siyangense TaxID=459529 RepID=UPI003DA2518F
MMTTLIRFLFTYFYSFYLRRRGVYIKANVIISINTKFGGRNSINSKTNVYNSSIGFGTYLGKNVELNNAIVGKYCSIASGVKILPYTHPSKIFVSTHPAFFSLLKQAGFTYVNKQRFKETVHIEKDERIFIEIGNDVWIGEDAKLMGGIKVGDGAIIGAGALVTKDVPPYAIMVGVPARKIKSRFNDDDINFLKHLRWWDKDEDWIKNNIELFDNIEAFIDKVNKI